MSEVFLWTKSESYAKFSSVLKIHIVKVDFLPSTGQNNDTVNSVENQMKLSVITRNVL